MACGCVGSVGGILCGFGVGGIAQLALAPITRPRTDSQEASAPMIIRAFAAVGWYVIFRIPIGEKAHRGMSFMQRAIIGAASVDRSVVMRLLRQGNARNRAAFAWRVDRGLCESPGPDGCLAVCTMPRLGHGTLDTQPPAPDRVAIPGRSAGTARSSAVQPSGGNVRGIGLRPLLTPHPAIGGRRIAHIGQLVARAEVKRTLQRVTREGQACFNEHDRHAGSIQIPAETRFPPQIQSVKPAHLGDDCRAVLIDPPAIAGCCSAGGCNEQGLKAVKCWVLLGCGVT